MAEDKPQMNREGTMQATAKEGIEYLKATGASTLPEVREFVNSHNAGGDSENSEKPKITRDNTMIGTAKDGLSYLDRNPLNFVPSRPPMPAPTGGSFSITPPSLSPDRLAPPQVPGSTGFSSPPRPPGVPQVPAKTVAELIKMYPSAATHMTPIIAKPPAQGQGPVRIAISTPVAKAQQMSPAKPLQPQMAAPIRLVTVPKTVVVSPPKQVAVSPPTKVVITAPSPPVKPSAPGTTPTKSPIKRDGTMVGTAKEGVSLLAASGRPDEDAMTRGQQKKIEEIQAEQPPAKKPKMARDSTMADTAKAAAAILNASGGAPDSDAMTRGQQKKIEEIQNEPAPKKPRMARDSTMADTAKAGKEYLGKEKLGETRAETKARQSRGNVKRLSTLDKTMQEAKDLLKSEGFSDTSEGRVTRSSRRGGPKPPPPPPKKAAKKTTGTTGGRRGRPKKNPAPATEPADTEENSKEEAAEMS